MPISIDSGSIHGFSFLLNSFRVIRFGFRDQCKKAVVNTSTGNLHCRLFVNESGGAIYKVKARICVPSPVIVLLPALPDDW